MSLFVVLQVVPHRDLCAIHESVFSLRERLGHHRLLLCATEQGSCNFCFSISIFQAVVVIYVLLGSRAVHGEIRARRLHINWLSVLAVEDKVVDHLVELL